MASRVRRHGGALPPPPGCPCSHCVPHPAWVTPVPLRGQLQRGMGSSALRLHHQRPVLRPLREECELQIPVGGAERLFGSCSLHSRWQKASRFIADRGSTDLGHAHSGHSGAPRHAGLQRCHIKEQRNPCVQLSEWSEQVSRIFRKQGTMWDYDVQHLLQPLFVIKAVWEGSHNIAQEVNKTIGGKMQAAEVQRLLT